MEKSISVIYGWCMKFSLDNGSQEEVNNKTGWEEYTPLGIHNTVVEYSTMYNSFTFTAFLDQDQGYS